MILSKIGLWNVRSFKEPIEIELEKNTNVFSFSGVNGSGKSTILKSVWYVQKYYFLSKENRENELYGDLRDFFGQNQSYIYCEFSEGDAVCSVKLFKEADEFSLIFENEDLINKYWGKNIPESIVLFVSSDRVVDSPSVDFSSISLEDFNEKKILSLIIEEPNRIFSTIYSKIVYDYIYQRLIPSKPDRLTYYHVATKFFEDLLPNVEIKNFSGKHTENKFVLLGKNKSNSKSRLYDVKNFSSGERALFSILNLIFLTSKISTVIIDEPENNFHSSLLMSFISLLNDFCNGDFISKITDLNSFGEGRKKIKEEWINQLYQDMSIKKIILATHSKDLIYRIFYYGKNYVVSRSVYSIEEHDAESKLRRIGITQVSGRILFVEGEEDKLFLESILFGNDISVRSLTGSDSVISTWKRVQGIKDAIKDLDMVFLLDSDNKKEDIIREANSIDADFCSRTLHVLERHELESYLLDVNLIKDTVSGIVKSLPGSDDIDADKIIEIIKSAYKDTKAKSILKDVSNFSREIVYSIMSDALWGSRDFRKKITDGVIPLSKEDVSECLGDNLNNVISEKIEIIARDVFSNFSDNLSFEKILKICDGKAVFNITCSKIGKIIGVDAGRLKSAILINAKNSESSDFYIEVRRIIEKFPRYDVFSEYEEDDDDLIGDFE